MATVNYQEKGVVFDIQRFSVNDGPGIRSIVFLKGCPLSCLWCCNPESQRIEPDVMYDQKKCIGCGKCMKACRQGAIGPENLSWVDRSKCIGCGECVNVCPTGALTLKGEVMSVNEIIQVLRRDAHYFRKSGGGVTLSGGEPLTQWRFARELLKACKAQGWDTAIETTAYGTDEAIEAVIPYVDLVLMDCKSTDPEVHKRVTGVSNEKIRKNAAKIVKIANQVIIRVPTIPTVNAFEEEYLEHINEHKCAAKVCQAMRKYVINPEFCKGCSKCAKNCPVGAISGKVKHPFHIDPNICIKCGACKENCAFNAIYIEE